MLDESYASTHFEVTPGCHAMLAVSDNGVGMDAQTQARIFEPFFTTKGPNQGTGLGLATVFGIVKQSGGSIWVYSEPGRGTTFRIYLPETDGEPEERSETIQPASYRGTETILLAEDQDDVRAVAAKILKRHGYHVLEAENAGEALLICEKHPRTIHLLVTDVIMPKMSGPELAERLRELRPEMLVLYTSGYGDAAIIQHGILDPGVAYLQKPISPGTLVSRVRELLDAHGAKTSPPSRAVD
jgi:CheY-like chemotaxis protein